MSRNGRSHLLDASAVLALLHREPGWDAVAALLPDSAISSVNWSEVLQKAGSRGLDLSELQRDFLQLGVDVLEFGMEEAADAARLWLEGLTSLALADRACLGTARLRGMIAVTADRAWSGLGLPVSLQIIR